MNKKFFVAALALLTLISITSLSARAQSCPIDEAFGVRSSQAVDKTLQAQFEVTYFTTDDPNVFISEKDGLKRSASYLSVNTAQFVAKLESLENKGLARIKKQQSATSFLGELAEMNLERNLGNAGLVNASLSSNDMSLLDRKSEVSVLEKLNGSDYYRVSLLSWFVDAASHGGQRVVDYDAIVLLKPGQTAIFKLGSSYEVKRNGAARSYVAVTMRSVNNTSLASLSHRR